MAAISYTTPGTPSTILSSASTGLANNAYAGSGTASVTVTASNNKTTPKLFGWFELYVHDFGGTPTDGGFVTLFLATSNDGTTYADGHDGSVAPALELAVGTFTLRNVDAPQRLHLWNIPLPPLHFKPVLLNKAGQTLVGNGTATTLTVATYDYQVI